MRQVAPAELAARLTREPGAVAVVDVREPWERSLCAIEGSLHIPLGQLPARLAELDPARPTAVVCHHGVRSLRACAFLAHHGFEEVLNLQGGIDAWARDLDPAMALY